MNSLSSKIDYLLGTSINESTNPIKVYSRNEWYEVQYNELVKVQGRLLHLGIKSRIVSLTIFLIILSILLT